MSVHKESKQITITTLRRMKKDKQKIVCLTAYDATFAYLLNDAGIDVVLVGDSLGMVMQGHDTTVPVTLNDMIYHAQCALRGNQRAFFMVDMPFMSYASPSQAVMNAARLMQEGGAQIVKLEGGVTQLDTVMRLAEHGIPVCAHLGLQPQSIHKLGAYKVQGKDEQSAHDLLEGAIMLQKAGADVLLLECVPALLAAEISINLDIPVIGIGAGHECDGQILVLQDVIGITVGRTPRFVHNFMAGSKSVQEAVRNYADAVRSGAFPGPEHAF